MFQEKYKIVKKVARGRNGFIYKGYRMTDQQEVAIKVWHIDDIWNFKTALKELLIMTTLKDANILLTIDIRLDQEIPTKIYQIMPLQPFNLSEFIQQTNILTEQQINEVAYQLINSVFQLHSQNIIHRDIKPQNFLINTNHQVFLIDFESCTWQDRPQSPYIQTRSYRAPEVVNQQPYDEKVDIWSLGCVLYELIQCRFSQRTTLFKADQCFPLSPCFDTVDQCKDLKHQHQNFSLNLLTDNLLDNIVEQMLTINPECRPTIHQIIAQIHSFSNTIQNHNISLQQLDDLN